MSATARTGLLLALAVAPAVAQHDTTTARLHAQVAFDTGTLQQLLYRPTGVLAEEEAFWQREPAQRFTRSWSEGTGVAIDYARWRDEVRALATRSSSGPCRISVRTSRPR